MSGAAPPAPPRRAAFLDRDGVINRDHGYVYRIADFEFLDGVREAAARLAHWGYAIVVVTNQAGIGRGMYTEDDFDALTHWMCARFAEAGVPVAGVYHCPHHPTMALGERRRACRCRKPAPGMLLDAARDLQLDLAASVIFGDKCDDLRAGQAAGVGVRVLLGKDAHGVPEDPCPDAPPQHRYASLADAVADARLRAALGVDAVPAAAGAPAADAESAPGAHWPAGA